MQGQRSKQSHQKKCCYPETNSLDRGHLKKSRISFSGKTPEIFSSCVDAAKQLGRPRCYTDEKRRLLSIIAMDYPYSVLQKYFQCSYKTVTAAKVHCILFGRGVPVEKLKFTRQCVIPQVLEELTEFLHRNDVSRASSCRSVLVDGEETAVRYWQDTVKGLINQYLLEFPDGVRRTYNLFICTCQPISA